VLLRHTAELLASSLSVFPICAASRATSVRVSFRASLQLGRALCRLWFEPRQQSYNTCRKPCFRRSQRLASSLTVCHSWPLGVAQIMAGPVLCDGNTGGDKAHNSEAITKCEAFKNGGGPVGFSASRFGANSKARCKA